MKLSHSKLNCILSCPMTYHLRYEEGLCQKTEKPALAIGSAVHWGIEHNTEDLSEYFNNPLCYTREQMLAESMVHGYLKHKEEIFDKILTDPIDGSKLTLVDETHEIFIDGKLKSFKFKENHIFVGIIDLLLLTDKGFIVVDYKTSTYIPNWDDYIEQLYRYCFLIRSEFPEVPIVKIAIVNVRKTGIRQKKGENESQFLNRMKFEYDVNDEQLVNYHEFSPEDLNEILYQGYINNLSKMADAAEAIVDEKQFFINYGAAKGQYGKSEFYDVFYHTPDAHLLYTIADTIYDEDEDKILDRRDCIPLDMKMIDEPVLNKYSKFKEIIDAYVNDPLNIQFPPLDLVKDIYEIAKEKYTIDDTLFEKYFTTYYKLQEKNS